MQVKDLSSTPFDEVMNCFHKSFENYFVTLPLDINYWKNRFNAIKVDWKLSFGMFDGDELIGFIINAVDVHNQSLTAYNTGTGVLPEYRGRQIVDQLYTHAFEIFKKKGIKKCLLEVICENSRAIAVYKRIGFEILRELRSYSGTISSKEKLFQVEKTDYRKVLDHNLYRPQFYTWESSAETILNSGAALLTYLLKNEQEDPMGYFCIDQNSVVLQLDSEEKDSNFLLSGISGVSKNVKIKNVPAQRKDLLNAVISAGLENTVNQYEMQLYL